MSFISNRFFCLKFFVLATCLLGVSFSLQAKESFEGIWANTKTECLDLEGPNSRTLIDLTNKKAGKALPIYDQYENHCQILNVSRSKKNIALSLVCFEFWEDMENSRDGHTMSISLISDGKDSLRISRDKYIRCKK